MEPSLNVLKQPEPNIVSNNATTTKRETLRPNVGVVDVPAISSPTTSVSIYSSVHCGPIQRFRTVARRPGVNPITRIEVHILPQFLS